MESVGASDRVIEFLDRPVAVQLSKGVKPQQFKGNVSSPSILLPPPCIQPLRTTLFLNSPCHLSHRVGADPPLLTATQEA